MDEPPAKRAKRETSSALWDKQDHANVSPRSPRPHDSRNYRSSHADGGVNGRYESRASQGHRRHRSRSRSPREKDSQSRRERSRSRERERDKDYKDRDRDRDGRYDHRRDTRRDRSRSRERNRRPRSGSRSPMRNGSTRGAASTRPRSPGRGNNSRSDHDRSRTKPEPREKDVKHQPNGAMDVMDMDVNDDDAMMKKMLGFSSFKSTKNTKVPGNQIYGVRKEKKTEYRQYMNRVGGFNRPLSPSR